MTVDPEPPPLSVGPEDVEAAAARIADDVVRTHSEHSRTLSELTGAHLVVKFENLQFTGSFKDRGSANRLRLLTPEERQRGVVAASAGNHAQGVAYHGGRLGIATTIVMPTSAPFTKVRHTRGHGATVEVVGRTLAESALRAEEIARTEGRVLVPAYDDPGVIAGQGTVGLELLEDHPDLDTIVVPVGGGGLIAGIATIVKAARPDIRVIGVQSERYPSMVAALKGEPFETNSVDTLADGIAVKRAGHHTVPIVRALVDDIVVVPERRIEEAVVLFAEIEKTVAEGAGGVGLAAMLHEPERFRGANVAVVLSGGNIDSRLLASVLLRGLVRDGRIATLRIHIDDLPGQLAPVLTALAESGANVMEVEHRRLFEPFTPRRVDVDVVIETSDGQHTQQVIDTLRAQGFDVERL
ncbi:MAG: threonine ammonia-lyase [Acidimicrobiales bacterium]|jgi:threonine dehydratase|nr:threonine ammonia-lyase [Acidimicrobiales bacterium]